MRDRNLKIEHSASWGGETGSRKVTSALFGGCSFSPLVHFPLHTGSVESHSASKETKRVEARSALSAKEQ